jgi:hypothetical protein
MLTGDLDARLRGREGVAFAHDEVRQAVDGDGLAVSGIALDPRGDS